jgi:nitronate monooxygenase
MKPLKIGKHLIEIPIIQGGMGVGISWDKLAGNVSKEGGLGVVSAVGTGYYKNKFYSNKNVSSRPYEAENFYSREALFEIIKNAKEISNGKPVGVNILYAINDYGRVVQDACEAGADIIITGAGIPSDMPKFTTDFPDVALIPIVSSARALKIIAKKWKRYNRLPDAVILEGPESGGHQGFTYEQCFEDQYRLENLVKPVVEEARNWGDIPIIPAGGIWDKKDIDQMISLGGSGVQMGTRFIGTVECDASDEFKNVLLGSKKEDIQLMKSPVGYPARGVRTALHQNIENGTAPKVACISNCVSPCHRGEEARAVGFCIADRLADSYNGDLENGLYFSGSNGYRLNEIITVKELIKKLVDGE